MLILLTIMVILIVIDAPIIAWVLWGAAVAMTLVRSASG